jgi:hypothetical protein
MNIKHLATMAVAAGAIFGASAASATVGVATLTGTLGYNGDNAAATGLFGPAAGQAFTAVFTFDTALGHHDLAPGISEVNYGGAITGPYDSPILAASLTINGVTRAFTSELYGNAQTFDHGADDEILWVATGADNSQLVGYFATAPGVMGGDFSHSFSVDPSGPAAPGGIPGPDFLGNFGRFDLNNGNGAVYLLATHLTVDMRLADTSPAGAAPEPATWAIMLLGFGGAGAMLRRRRAALAA